MKDVENKVAVITGAASGIGRGMAQSFAAAGMKVVLSDIEAARLTATCKELREAGADVHAVVTDVSKPSEVSALAQQTSSHYGAVHVLCNNAGVGISARPSWSASLDDWNWVLGVNLMGVIHGIRSFMPIMIEQGTEGHIINTASLAGLVYGENTIYTVSKFGVVGLSESIALELQRSGHKLKVSVLCPGWVKTDILSSRRNWPGGGEGAIAPPVSADPVAQTFAQWVTDQVAQGLDPRAVGDQVLDAIQSERFYVLTHPAWQPMIEHRAKTLLSGGNPSALLPPGAESLTRKLANLAGNKPGE